MNITNVLFAATVLFSTAANAALVGSADGKTVYDTDLNITWLSNANLGATNIFGLQRNVDLGTIPGVNTFGGSYIFEDGGMTWGAAKKWIAAMNSANYLGYNDWRLPTSDSCYGYNCGGEMAHLYLNELGGNGYSITVAHNANYDLFSNFMSSFYWSGSEYVSNNNQAWNFWFSIGLQSHNLKDQGMYVMAVRDGQIAAVPVPAAVWLLGSGLMGLIGVARRKPK